VNPVALSLVVLCAVLCLGCLSVTVAVVVTAARPAGRGPAMTGRAGPESGLTVLFDQDCERCRDLSRWLAGQRQLVPLDLVPAASPAAWRRFPRLDHGATRAAITVVGEGGQVYTGDAAWIACLWALAEYRSAAYRLAGAAPQAGP
jgi:predicted DCC family thiol-disulfide oxidoreductase YuxK